MAHHTDDHTDEGRDPAATEQRRVAPGGWRRALIGLAMGALAGALIAFVLPRDDLPRRREATSPVPPPEGSMSGTLTANRRPQRGR